MTPLERITVDTLRADRGTMEHPWLRAWLDQITSNPPYTDRYPAFQDALLSRTIDPWADDRADPETLAWLYDPKQMVAAGYRVDNIADAIADRQPISPEPRDGLVREPRAAHQEHLYSLAEALILFRTYRTPEWDELLADALLRYHQQITALYYNRLVRVERETR